MASNKEAQLQTIELNGLRHQVIKLVIEYILQ